ncbi:MAG: hypothetical protein M0017_00705 [Desulfobacteraceae bacterium]|nr:hypothetical protein [Desulfobacteraceae bacterium]
MNRSFASGLTLAAVLFAGMLLAPAGAFSLEQAQHPAAPQEEEYQGVPYVSGGIGEGQREAMEQQASKYNLKIIYALAQGNYLALVDTTIKDPQGKTVLQTTAQGPWLFAKLPAGTYTVSAKTLQDETQEKKVKIPAEGREQVTFVWRRGQEKAEGATTPR